MASIALLHSNFVASLIEASKLFPYHSFSLLPSVLFLVSIFVLLYLQFHKRTTVFTRWQTRIFKDLVFHWTYFYTSRIWFVFLKVCRWALQYSDRALAKSSTPDEVYVDQLVTRSCVFLIVLSIALLPCLILYARYLNRREIPNFLMWVAEDPWVRSEIGTSGHYLERPPQADVYSPHKHNTSFRSGRSSSVDTNVYLDKPSSVIRPCKSAVSMKKSSEELIGQ